MERTTHQTPAGCSGENGRRGMETLIKAGEIIENLEVGLESFREMMLDSGVSLRF